MATTTSQAIALRNVLIATDFSPCSERALLHAVAAAHHFGSTLHVVHIVQPTTFFMIPPDGYMGSPEVQNLATELARVDSETMMTDVLRRNHCEDVRCKTWIKTGLVGESLRGIIDREHIDLAVVGTHGRTGLRRIVLGSVAEYVFRNASCPVVTVGPHSWPSTDPQKVHLKHILVPTDLSAESAHALPFIMAVAAEFNARLTMMNVIEHLDREAAQDRRRVFSAIEERMREMTFCEGPRPAAIDFRVKTGDVAETVIQSAAELGVDLVAFGLKAPDTYVDRLPWMHAYKMVCELACPVLSLRGASGRA